jgi:hypothetical protein
MKLKESLDWKTIAVQQMSQTVDKCKVMVHTINVRVHVDTHLQGGLCVGRL